MSFSISYTVTTIERRSKELFQCMLIHQTCYPRSCFGISFDNWHTVNMESPCLNVHHVKSNKEVVLVDLSALEVSESLNSECFICITHVLLDTPLTTLQEITTSNSFHPLCLPTAGDTSFSCSSSSALSELRLLHITQLKRSLAERLSCVSCPPEEKSFHRILTKGIYFPVRSYFF